MIRKRQIAWLLAAALLLVPANEAAADRPNEAGKRPAPHRTRRVVKPRVGKQLTKTRPGKQLTKTRPGKRLVKPATRKRLVKPATRQKGLVKTAGKKPAKTRQVKPAPTGQLRSLRAYLVSAPVEKLAGTHKDLLRSSKINELLSAARGDHLSEHDVATFAQSVHPRLLRVFEKGAGLPGGYFLSITRQAQFQGGNPFQAPTPPTPAQQVQLRQGLVAHLMKVVRLHRAQGGKTMPRAIQLLTSTSHLQAPKGPGGDLKAVGAAVESIPIMELARRHSYITGIAPKAVLAQMPTRRQLAARKDLVNFDHLLGALGKTQDGKLLVEIYAENMPAKGKVGRFLPVTALGEGSYCVDDIARTTVALLQAHKRRPNPRLLAKARAGLKFVAMMQATDGEFYNFATLSGGKLKVNRSGATSKKGIDFWAGRALWAMGEGYTSLRKVDPAAARALQRRITRTLNRLEQPLSRYGRYRTVDGKKLPTWLINDAADQTAVALKGVLALYRGLAPGKLRDRTGNIITRYAEGLAAAQIKDPAAKDLGRFLHSTRDPKAIHLWGSRQVEVLAEAGRLLNREDFIKAATLCADNYWGKATPTSIGAPGEEQIAYGMESVVSGYARLHEATGKRRFAQQTFRWASWFFGNNKAGAVVYDPMSGRGYDGLRALGKGAHFSVNGNSGAESTVESILALQSAARVPGVHERLRTQLGALLPK